MTSICPLVIFLSCIIGIYAPITFRKGSCVDSAGQNMDTGTTWYNPGECARYGCYISHDESITYKESCPEYPIPNCHYNLKHDPNGPFPECCDVPYCRPFFSVGVGK